MNALRTILCTTALLLPALVTAAATNEPGFSDPEETIGYLLEHVSKSPLTFVRNGEHHDGREAARHMSRKYEHFRNEIKSAEDFIRLCASKSLLTGRLYTVIDAGGEQTPTGEWLRKVLAQYRASSGRPPQEHRRAPTQPVPKGE